MESLIRYLEKAIDSLTYCSKLRTGEVKTNEELKEVYLNSPRKLLLNNLGHLEKTSNDLLQFLVNNPLKIQQLTEYDLELVNSNALEFDRILLSFNADLILLKTQSFIKTTDYFKFEQKRARSVLIRVNLALFALLIYSTIPSIDNDLSILMENIWTNFTEFFFIDLNIKVDIYTTYLIDFVTQWYIIYLLQNNLKDQSLRNLKSDVLIFEDFWKNKAILTDSISQFERRKKLISKTVIAASRSKTTKNKQNLIIERLTKLFNWDSFVKSMSLFINLLTARLDSEILKMQEEQYYDEGFEESLSSDYEAYPSDELREELKDLIYKKGEGIPWRRSDILKQFDWINRKKNQKIQVTQPTQEIRETQLPQVTQEIQVTQDSLVTQKNNNNYEEKISNLEMEFSNPINGMATKYLQNDPISSSLDDGLNNESTHRQTDSGFVTINKLPLPIDHENLNGKRSKGKRSNGSKLTIQKGKNKKSIESNVNKDTYDIYSIPASDEDLKTSSRSRLLAVNEKLKHSKRKRGDEWKSIGVQKGKTKEIIETSDKDIDDIYTMSNPKHQYGRRSRGKQNNGKKHNERNSKLTDSSSSQITESSQEKMNFRLTEDSEDEDQVEVQEVINSSHIKRQSLDSRLASKRRKLRSDQPKKGSSALKKLAINMNI